MLYEGILLAAVAFFAGVLFHFMSGGREATGWLRVAYQAYLLAVFAAYFLWCWLRGGQTLAMKAWRIKVVAPGHGRVPPAKALLRFSYAALFIGAFLVAILAAFAHRNPYYAFATLAFTGVGLGWALFDRDRQFLYDRLAGTRLVTVAR